MQRVAEASRRSAAILFSSPSLAHDGDARIARRIDRGDDGKPAVGELHDHRQPLRTELRLARRQEADAQPRPARDDANPLGVVASRLPQAGQLAVLRRARQAIVAGNQTEGLDPRLGVEKTGGQGRLLHHSVTPRTAEPLNPNTSRWTPE